MLPTHGPVPVPRRRREQGFTITELIVALFVTVEVLVAVLLLFDFNTRLARVQTNVAEMQQSQRVAQYDIARLVRMAGRGGLPQNLAFTHLNNVGAGTLIGGPGTEAVVPGTDVLQVRGVFTSPIYQVLADESVLTLDREDQPALATSGSIVISAFTPTGVPQDLHALREVITCDGEGEGVAEPLVLISSQGETIRAVVELVPDDCVVTNSQITLNFRITGGTNTAAFSTLSTGGAFSNDLTAVAFVGILEEYRFYVREEYAVAGDETSDFTPKLARGRFFPGTNLPYSAGADALDVADNVLDLQVALGFDTAQAGGALRDDEDNIEDDDRIGEVADGSNDDWLFNGAADSPVNLGLWNGAPLYYARVSTLVRTDQRDPDYRAPELRRLEDKDYTDSDYATVNAAENRMYRRRVLQTVIDLRNL